MPAVVAAAAGAARSDAAGLGYESGDTNVFTDVFLPACDPPRLASASRVQTAGRAGSAACGHRGGPGARSRKGRVPDGPPCGHPS